MDLSNVLKALLATPHAHTLKDEYVYVRCPMCGDSLKHPDKCHCSIWVRPAMPLIYHCWICEESGVVGSNFLQSMGILDLGVSNTLAQYNKATMKGKKITSFSMMRKDYKLLIPSIQDTELNRRKLEYMQKRIGKKFTYKSMEYLRIIFSIKDFLKVNELKVNSKFMKNIYYLDRDYIGFLSSTRDVITMRSIDPNSKYRYVKYFVFEDQENPEQMYAIPNRIDPMSDTVTINISEGTFDTLGVFFNVKKGELDNQIYVSVCGSAYKKVLQNFLKKGFLNNLVVNIYSDSDKGPEFYNKLMDEYSPWVKEFHIFYNTIKDAKGKSDFGVPEDEILVKEFVL